MLKEILKKVHNLEDLLVEKRAAADVLNCEMFRYLSTT